MKNFLPNKLEWIAIGMFIVGLFAGDAQAREHFWTGIIFTIIGTGILAALFVIEEMSYNNDDLDDE